MNAIVGEFAENGFSSFGHHGHMHDARFAPCARLLPSGGFVGYGDVGNGGHTFVCGFAAGMEFLREGRDPGAKV